MATVFIQKKKRMHRYSYIVMYKNPITGKNKYYKTFQKLNGAQKEANKLRNLLDNGELNEIEKKKQKILSLTFRETGELLDQAWKQKLINLELSSITYEDYSLRLNRLNTSFGKKLLCEIQKKILVDYRNKLAEEISNATSNRYLFILKQVFRQGLAERAIIDDVSKSINYLSEKCHERDRFLLPDEIDKLIEASRQTRAKFYMPALILLGVEHAASRQEALSLNWNDINFDFEGKEFKGLITFFRTKNGKRRTDSLMPRTRQALKSWKDHLEWMRHRKGIDAILTDAVFCRLNGQPIKRFDSAWQRLCEIAGVEDLHFHDLRHTYCSNLLFAGANLKDVKEMNGHSDISMTDRYAHITSPHKQYLQRKLAEHYASGNEHASYT